MSSLRSVVTEREIRLMVERFYGRVQDDDLLFPVFDRLLTHGWDAHVDRMVDFWASILLGARRFQGDPVARHRAIHELGPQHFDRWLLLFGEVLDDTFPEHIAKDILWRAQRMRHVLEPSEPPDADPRLTVLTTTRAT